MRALRSAVATLGLLTIVAVGAVIAGAKPAAAHGVGGLQPTDYETVVRGVFPPARGVSVRTSDLGTKLELRNVTPVDVVVLGYDGEPYLRIGPRGVFENARSPATFLNRAATISRALPKSYDSAATPRWRKLSTGNVARWHDHRAHWMGTDDPPAVRHDRSRAHLVIRDWRVPLRIAGVPAAVRGDARWVPPQSPWPWLLCAVGVAAATIALGRTRWWPRVLAVALALLLLSETAHVLGSWGASTAGSLGKLGAGVYSMAGWVLGVVALVWLARRPARDATPVVLVAALFLFIAGGLADVASLTRSQLPTTLPDWVARVSVTLALGLGAGILVTAALRLRPPPRPLPANPQPRAPAEASSR